MTSVLSLAVLCATASVDTRVATASCPAAGGSQTTVASSGCTGVSAHRGRIVWSSSDPATGRYALMTAAGGAVGAVPQA